MYNHYLHAFEIVVFLNIRLINDKLVNNYLESPGMMKGAIASPPLICCYAPHIYCIPRTPRIQSTLNYFGMFVMTLHYGQHLKLAPIS
jgi:hypothetical protein